jgi:nucleoside phosphorylase
VTRTSDVLVLAAFEPELAPLREALREAFPGAPGEVAGVRVAATAVGIGLPAASVGAALSLGGRRELLPPPRLAILVGTCGAYVGAGLAIGEVAVARRVHLVAPCSLAALGGLTQFPGAMVLVRDTHPETATALERAGARPADVATTLGVTVDDRAAAEIALATSSQIEHMEAYGVATACEAAHVPFAAVLGVANMVGSMAREQWRAHHRDAARAAIAVVLRWLEEGAVGLPSRMDPRPSAE